MVYTDNDDCVGVFTIMSKITHYDNQYAYADVSFILVPEASTVGDNINTMLCNINQVWKYNHPDYANPVLNFSFDIAYAPVVKQVLMVGEAAIELAGSDDVRMLVSDLPFDPTTATIYEMPTGIGAVRS